MDIYYSVLYLKPLSRAFVAATDLTANDDFTLFIHNSPHADAFVFRTLIDILIGLADSLQVAAVVILQIGSIDIVLRGVGQKSRVGALNVLPDLPFKLAVVALGLVELPVVRPRGAPLRAGLQQLPQPLAQRALLPRHLDQGHQGDQADG